MWAPSSRSRRRRGRPTTPSDLLRIERPVGDELRLSRGHGGAARCFPTGPCLHDRRWRVRHDARRDRDVRQAAPSFHDRRLQRQRLSLIRSRRRTKAIPTTGSTTARSISRRWRKRSAPGPTGPLAGRARGGLPGRAEHGLAGRHRRTDRPARIPGAQRSRGLGGSAPGELTPCPRSYAQRQPCPLRDYCGGAADTRRMAALERFHPRRKLQYVARPRRIRTESGELRYAFGLCNVFSGRCLTTRRAAHQPFTRAPAAFMTTRIACRSSRFCACR